MKTLLMLTALLSAQALALDGPARFNFEGVLLNDGTNTPMTGPVALRFQIYDPSATCLIFQEDHASVSLDSSGAFSVKVGSGTRAAAATDGGVAWKQIFQNTSQVRSTGTNCAAGYTPATGDARLLRVTVNGSTTLSPDFVLGSVPFATVADSLQGYGPTDFLNAANGGAINGALQINLQNQLRLSDASTNYVAFRAPSPLGANTVYTLPAAYGSNGQVLTTNGSGQLSWSAGGGGSAASIQGYAISAVPPTNGQILAWNGSTSQWMPKTIAAAPVTSVNGLTGAVTIDTSNATYLQTRQVSGAAPVSGEVLTWNGSAWMPAPPPVGVMLGGNTMGMNVSIGTNDNFDLTLRTNNSVRMTVNAAGRVGIGTPIPSTGSVADFFGAGSGFSSIRVPRDTTVNRPAPLDGSMRYNTTIGRFEVVEGGVWVNMTAGPPVERGIEVFTTSGTFTVPPGVTSVKVIVIGGGGGGCNSVGGGGNGGAGVAYVNQLTPSQNVTVTVGTGGPFGTNGTAGGPSSFGTFVTSTAGAGCTGGSQGANGNYSDSGPPVSGSPLDSLRGTYQAGMGGAMSVNGQPGIVVVEW